DALRNRLLASGAHGTAITDQLEREGLVVRTLDRGDRRAITVKLTAAGLKRFREMAASHERWIVELLGGLSQEDRQSMLLMLGKLKAHLGAVSPMLTHRKPGPAARRK